MVVLVLQGVKEVNNECIANQNASYANQLTKGESKNGNLTALRK